MSEQKSPLEFIRYIMSSAICNERWAKHVGMKAQMQHHKERQQGLLKKNQELLSTWVCADRNRK